MDTATILVNMGLVALHRLVVSHVTLHGRQPEWLEVPPGYYKLVEFTEYYGIPIRCSDQFRAGHRTKLSTKSSSVKKK